ncbi:MAG: outer rane adhesin like protein, partial [Alphaproteobacteria bacterium]|nr:outer rane adhesin like protein [Alphaproteobacteria bacterium]
MKGLKVANISETVIDNNVTESGGVANGTAGDPNANGSVTTDDLGFNDASGQRAGTFGTFYITNNANGTLDWTYVLDEALAQGLGASDLVTDTLTVTSFDNTTHSIQVNVQGANDVPTLGGAATGGVTEDSGATLATGGALTIADDDTGQSTYAVQAGTTGSNGYGSFTLAADGSWTYAANNAQTAIQQLGTGQTLTDSFTAISSDGSANQIVTVTITGTNDVPTLGGVNTGGVTEDSGATLAIGGALTIVDADSGQSSYAVQAGTAGSNGYGSFSLAADGTWTYAANNSQTAIQQLGAGQTLTDSFTAISSDGSANRTVTVTITGTNDVPALGGVNSGGVTEDSGATLATGGALTIV